MRCLLSVLTLVAGISFQPLSAHAQWQVDGVPLCTADTLQTAPRAVPDGAGGAIVTWLDYRNDSSTDIYARRVDAAGVPLWTDNGVALCTAAGNQWSPTVTADGAGGAIVTWEDRRAGISDIYAQRVSAAGVALWTADGVPLCTAALDQWSPTIVSDGTGGAIVAWIDRRTGTTNIHAQRVDATGAPLWLANGVIICTAANEQYSPMMVSDDAGGGIVTWIDYRDGASWDIFAQRVSAIGVAQWVANGVLLCNAANGQQSQTVVTDGAGGAIVTWQDYRNGVSNTDIYAQRVNTLGVPQWAANGIALCQAVSNQLYPMTVADGAGGVIATWWDHQGGTADVYAQRADGSGVLQWAANGIAVSTAMETYAPIVATIASDGNGGAIITWEDERSETSADIYAQRVSAAGAPQWTADGVALSTAAGDQRNPTIVSDGAGGAIVTWQDCRSDPANCRSEPPNGNSDIYVQRVTDPLNAVAIASFDASQANGVVTLRSAFRSDLGVEAVNVYRANGAGHDQMIVIERVNDVRGDHFEYVDHEVTPGQSYRYRIGVVDADGEFFSPVVTVSVKAITVSLEQNQPNPFNPTTTIRFVLPVREVVTLSIYDANGHHVRTLVNEVQGYGAHEVTWDGRSDTGAVMGSGVYFYQLRAGKLTESKKMVLLK